ncbi:hypothetical protein [Thioclava sp.]|uniref:hypothetical protein n=1 Tax=Thioclava sp. TaxID=1933450 RepID=UPI003242951D
MTQNTQVATQAQKPVEKAQIKTGGTLAALAPQSIDEAFRLAEALSKAGNMVPQHYQGKPMETMAAIVKGMEVGLAPMQALSSIAVINGRASLWGDAMPALMQRAGHHIDVEIENEADLEKAVAVSTLTRGDTGKTITRRFSYQDAKRAGLAGKRGPWQEYPLRMLANRARAFAIRDGAADALMGIGIADEVSDYGPGAARDVTPHSRPAPRRGGVSGFIPADEMRNPDPEPDRDEIFDAETSDAPTESESTPTEDDLRRAEEEARAVGGFSNQEND